MHQRGNSSHTGVVRGNMVMNLNLLQAGFSPHKQQQQLYINRERLVGGFTSSSSELHLTSTREADSSVISSLPTPDRQDTWSICSAARLKHKDKASFKLLSPCCRLTLYTFQSLSVSEGETAGVGGGGEGIIINLWVF